MKILLVNANNDLANLKKVIDLKVPPFGLTYISYPLKKNGHNVEFFDASFFANPVNKFNAILRDFKPGVVGFSIRNSDNHSMLSPRTSLPFIKNLINCTKSNNIISVLGGAGYSAFPTKMLEYLNADFGISGQGENSFLKLVESFSQQEDYFNIPGLSYRDGNKIISNPPQNSGYKNIKADFNLFDFNNYKADLWCGTVIIKTGCPYKCTFCEAPRMGKKFLFREVDEVIDDIKFLHRTQNIQSFYLIDNCFNSPLDHAKKILHNITKNNLKIEPFCQISSRKGCYDEELFELYKLAGGKYTILGADSFSVTMLKSYDNGLTLDSIYNASLFANKHDININLAWLVGGPRETLDTINESLNFLKKLKYKNLFINTGIRILPENPIRQVAIDEGVITEKTDLLFPRFYFSEQISPTDAKEHIEKQLA